MEEKYTSAGLKGRHFFRVKFGRGCGTGLFWQHPRQLHSRGGFSWRFLCLHSIYLCTSCECVALIQGLAWHGVKGLTVPTEGEPKTVCGQQSNCMGEQMQSCGHMNMVMSARKSLEEQLGSTFVLDRGR